MPIVVKHDAAGPLAGIAGNVGAFAGQRALNAEALNNSQLALQQQQQQYNVAYQQAQLLQQARQQQMEYQLAQQRQSEQERYHQDQLGSAAQIADLNRQAQLQRAGVAGQYGLDRANVEGDYRLQGIDLQQQGQNYRAGERESGLDDRQLEKLAAQEQQAQNAQDFKTWVLERGHELKKGDLEDNRQYIERLATLRNQWANERQQKALANQQSMLGQRLDSTEGMAAQRAGAREQTQSRAAVIKQKQVEIDQLKTEIGYLQRKAIADPQAEAMLEARQRSLNDAFNDMRRLVGATTQPSMQAPPVAPAPMLPPAPQPGYAAQGGYGAQAGPSAQPPPGSPPVGQIIQAPDGRRGQIVGYFPDGEPQVVPIP